MARPNRTTHGPARFTAFCNSPWAEPNQRPLSLSHTLWAPLLSLPLCPRSLDHTQLLGVTRTAAIRFIAKAYVRAARWLIFIFDGPIVIYGPAVLLLPSNFFVPWLLCSRYAAGRRCHFIAAWFAPSPSPTIPVKCKFARPLFNFASSAYVSLDSFLYP